LKPRDSRAAYGLGNIYADQQKWENAEAAYRSAVEFAPKDVDALVALSVVLTQPRGGADTARRYVEAESFARKAVQIDPKHAIAWDRLGVALQARGLLNSETEHSYKRAIDLNGSFARARSQYARFLSAAGRSKDAVSQASQAAEIDPTSASAASTRAMALYYARDYVEAFKAIEHALALESGSASAYLVQSRIDEARGDLAAALLAAERALAIAGNGASTAWRVHVIRLQALLGEPEKARTALGQLSSDVAAGRRRVSTMQFALAHAALGDREQALQFFERALEEREPDMLWLAVDPRTDALRRSEPRLQRVVAELGIPR